MWGFSARRDTFGLGASLSDDDDNVVIAKVLALMDDWHPALRRLAQGTSPSTITTFPVKTSVPIPPWKTRRVTLLGDALHNMTPFRGIGANTALRDAATLRLALAAVAHGDADLFQALTNYERDMIGYGFNAVKTSLRDMKRTKGLSKTAVKLFLRVADRVPPLKAAFFRR